MCSSIMRAGQERRARCAHTSSTLRNSSLDGHKIGAYLSLGSDERAQRAICLQEGDPPVGSAPQGRQILLNLGHALKYDERWAGEKGRLSPHRFCPERWLSEEGQKTGAFLPFGGGLRMCVGYLLAQAEMKVCEHHVDGFHDCMQIDGC